MEFITNTVEETEKIGELLGNHLQAGDVVAYSGDLGAGKTAFTRGIAKGMGIEFPVTSPTYTIVNEYEGGRLPLFHFDLYRLSGEEELFDLGFEEYFHRGGVCVVEWSEIAGDSLEGQVISVELRQGETENTRIIQVEGISW